MANMEKEIKNDIPFEKAAFGGFKREKVVEYIEELQQELFKTKQEYERLGKEFADYRVQQEKDAAQREDETKSIVEKLKQGLLDAQRGRELNERQQQSVLAGISRTAREESAALNAEILRLKNQLRQEVQRSEKMAEISKAREVAGAGEAGLFAKEPSYGEEKTPVPEASAPESRAAEPKGLSDILSKFMNAKPRVK
ncbi:MAG: hypothetical protein FWF05_05050 [Oscillospiraceae bacterium]|nr:hypothetical protein [Oscillospiraceae bacterium]